MRELYLFVDFCTVVVPFLFSFHPKIRFDRYFKAFALSSTIVAFVFLAWDEIFVRMGIWSFNPRYVIGIYILSLPIEEVLFFFCIPFSCVFTWYCLSKFYRLTVPGIFSSILNGFILLSLVAGIVFFYDRWYTASTCTALLITYTFLRYFKRTDWLPAGTLVYLVLLIPFLIVNGILTGIATDEPVVIYNNAENVGRRIFTIPVEDVFYGFTFYLLNVYLLSKFRGIDQSKKPSNLLHRVN